MSGWPLKSSWGRSRTSRRSSRAWTRTGTALWPRRSSKECARTSQMSRSLIVLILYSWVLIIYEMYLIIRLRLLSNNLIPVGMINSTTGSSVRWSSRESRRGEQTTKIFPACQIYFLLDPDNRGIEFFGATNSQKWLFTWNSIVLSSSVVLFFFLHPIIFCVVLSKTSTLG